MAVQTFAGTTIGMSAAKPATFDEDGYTAASMVYSSIGEITDAGEHGRTYAEVEHKPIGTRGTQQFKGSFNEGNKTLQLGLDKDDAGQILAKTALDDDADYSFEVKYPDGSADYFQAKVMAFKKTTGSVDTILAGSIEISITTSKSGVGIVEVDAPVTP